VERVKTNSQTEEEKSLMLRVGAYCVSRGLYQAELARLLSVDPATVNAWSSGKNAISSRNQAKLNLLLSCPPQVPPDIYFAINKLEEVLVKHGDYERAVQDLKRFKLLIGSR